jgi:bacterioferritin (cytochrome b1)
MNDMIPLLNFYRASELHNGLILGQMVRRTSDPRLIVNLTRHSAEDIAHAQLLTETIITIGGMPEPVRATYHTHYAELVGIPVTLLDVLAMTQMFERSLYRHFTRHLMLPGLHQAVAATLSRMLEEEKRHLSWVRAWLEEQARERPREIRDMLGRYAVADQRLNDSLWSEYGLRSAA